MIDPPPNARRDARPATDGWTRPVDLVAIDIDGTLLTGGKQLRPPVAEAIRRCGEIGIRVVLASARPPRSVRQIYEVLALDTLTVHYNGALIHDPQRGRNFAHHPLEPGLVRRVVRAARKLDADCHVHIEILDRWYTDREPHAVWTTVTGKSFSPDFIGPLDAFLSVPVTKLMLLAPPRRLPRIVEMIRRRFAGMVNVAVCEEHLVQLMCPAIDKAKAVQAVAEHYGIDRRRTMAIGDAPNDRPMLDWAEIGVAVENAHPQIAAMADHTVGSNDDDGVAEALHRFALPGD